MAHAACALGVALLLVAVGQPIYTDDLWWHLGLGRAFSQHGPWLAADPLLFTAPGPPDTAAWLADLALYRLWSAAGFGGLRSLHVAAVAAVLALVWSSLRRASDSPAIASTGTLIFVALAAYRLAQLRPELVTLAATPLLYRWLIEPETPASARRIAASALLLGLWSNAHAGFALGLLMLGAAVLGLVAAGPWRSAELAERDRRRAARLAFALAAGFFASLANPGFLDPHLAWLRSGSETPDLARIADEWARFEPLSRPIENLPPTPLAFALQWALLLSTPIGVVWQLRRWRMGSPSTQPGVADPALAAWSVACLFAPFVAVRFLWLGLFPVLLLARGLQRSVPRPWLANGSALLACALLPGFVVAGDWRMISSLLPRSLAGYAEPYAVAKYHAHPIWFLEDAGITGNVFSDYALGGFLGFFGAPARRAFLNGSLNVTRDVIEANLPIRERRGQRDGEHFLELLDRMQIDVFVGTRLPRTTPSRRPWFYTTSHLERAPGWVRVFRNLDSAVYLRADERNAANLERVAAYYARAQVPFDAEQGFDPESAIRAAPTWSVTRGLVPVYFDELAASAGARDPEVRQRAADQLAPVYAALGLYEHALRVDRRTLRAYPDRLPARRRLVWSLLRLGRFEEADLEARALRAAPAQDALSHAIADVAALALTGSDPDATASRIARLPVLTSAEADRVVHGMQGPESRVSRAGAVPHADRESTDAQQRGSEPIPST